MDKAFKCDKDLLIKYMKYFEKYLTNASILDDIDISVHCDIKIFEWLIKYLHQKERQISIDNKFKTEGTNDQVEMDLMFAAKHVQYKKRSSEERQKEKEQS